MKRFFTVLFTIYTLCSSSCSSMMLEPAISDNNIPEEGTPVTRSVVENQQTDPTAIRHYFQTNHKIILIHHIELRDSIYVQTLSEEDMDSLHITEEERAFSDYYLANLNTLLKYE